MVIITIRSLMQGITEDVVFVKERILSLPQPRGGGIF
jgi:hypothetical protein